MLQDAEVGMSSRTRSEFGGLGERVRRRPIHCFVDGLHPGIVLSWSSGASGWVATVAFADEDGVLHVGPLPAARLRPV
jgi:hypothetical protein